MLRTKPQYAPFPCQAFASFSARSLAFRSPSSLLSTHCPHINNIHGTVVTEEAQINALMPHIALANSSRRLHLESKINYACFLQKYTQPSQTCFEGYIYLLSTVLSLLWVVFLCFWGVLTRLD
jgi:hypothetical protein